MFSDENKKRSNQQLVANQQMIAMMQFFAQASVWNKCKANLEATDSIPQQRKEMGSVTFRQLHQDIQTILGKESELTAVLKERNVYLAKKYGAYAAAFTFSAATLAGAAYALIIGAHSVVGWVAPLIFFAALGLAVGAYFIARNYVKKVDEERSSQAVTAPAKPGNVLKQFQQEVGDNARKALGNLSVFAGSRQITAENGDRCILSVVATLGSGQ